jgi:hypothetical protein
VIGATASARAATRGFIPTARSWTRACLPNGKALTSDD